MNFFYSFFHMLADISSVALFALLPANAIYMSISFYNLEAVRYQLVPSQLMIFIIKFRFFISLLKISFHKIYFSMWQVFFAQCFGHLLSVTLLLMQLFESPEFAIWCTIPIGLNILRSYENTWFLSLVARNNRFTSQDWAYFIAQWNCLQK